MCKMRMMQKIPFRKINVRTPLTFSKIPMRKHTNFYRSYHTNLKVAHATFPSPFSCTYPSSMILVMITCHLHIVWSLVWWVEDFWHKYYSIYEAFFQNRSFLNENLSNDKKSLVKLSGINGLNLLRNQLQTYENELNKLTSKEFFKGKEDKYLYLTKNDKQITGKIFHENNLFSKTISLCNTVIFFVL